MSGWICIDRKLLTWEWFDTPHMVHLWVYLLLSANYEPKRWRGKVIERGQLVCSWDSLSQATGISIQSLRTCMVRLENIGAITRQVTNKYTIVTISKYEEYQTICDVDQQANQQTSNKQLTTTEQINNNNNITTPRAYMCVEAREVLGVWSSWAEMVCMKCKVTPEQYPVKVSEFLTEMELQCKQWENENDMKAHFYNWLKLQTTERAKPTPSNDAPKVWKMSKDEQERIAQSEALQAEYKRNQDNKVPMPEDIARKWIKN